MTAMPDPLQYEFMRNAYEVGTVVAIVAAVVGFFVVLRGLSFAAHALSHIGFAGAAGAVLAGLDPLTGLLAFCIGAALIMGALGERLQGRDVAIGVVLAFSLGLGVLFLSLYVGFASETVTILFGTIVGVSLSNVITTTLLGALVLIALLCIFRPLLFASVAEEVSVARGLPVRTLSAAFLVLLAVTVSVAVQVVGVLLIFTLLVAPPAAAAYLSTRASRTMILAAVIGVLSTWAGMTLAYYTGYPVSFFIASIAVSVYGLARVAASLGLAGANRSRETATAESRAA
jgi:zinc/manganese transport system permease protein